MATAGDQIMIQSSSSEASTPHDLLHSHSHRQLWSRRRFFQTSGLLAGVVAAGLPGGEGIALAAHCGSRTPNQLPDFSPILKDIFGIEIPGHLAIEVDPFASTVQPLANPSMIWDFKGLLGLIEADGVSAPTHNSDGVARRWACDVRFMTGVFQNRAGRKQHGTFGFI